MIKKIKEYLEYRKNKKIAKRELVKITSTTLPLVTELSSKGKDVVNFVIKLSNETKNVEGEKMVELVLNELSTALQTNNNRIIEILTYIANFQPDEIQKIITHSIVETLPSNEEK